MSGCGRLSPYFSPDPLTIPWGKLISQNGSGALLEMTPRPPLAAKQPAAAAAVDDGGNNSNDGGGGGGGNIQFKSPRNINHNNTRTPSTSSSRSPSPCGGFMGLRNVVSGDRFNEYTLGRSIKADVTVAKLVDDTIITATAGTDTNNNTKNDGDNTKTAVNNKQAMYDYVHSSVSNKHCRIFCILSAERHHRTIEVFVEDTSGNGTLINNTTLLRKNERRKLHTGDVVCLVNPQFIMKRIRSGSRSGGSGQYDASERKLCISQYSYVFVNLWEQEARGGGGIGCGGGIISPKYNIHSGSRGGGGAAVNARAVKMHSAQPKSQQREVGNAAAGGATRQSMTTSTATTAADANRKDDPKRNSLGSFLHDSAASDDPNNSNNHHRNIEQEYDLREPLGTGTCGEVRRAIHRRSGDERAVKIIPIGGRLGGISAAASRFSHERLDGIKAEAEILRSLHHPYIVKLYDAYVSPGRAIYLVMELVRGGDLFDRIVERGRYTEVRARRLMRRILAAVYHLHEERGIVHRDLKPEVCMFVS